ATATGLTTTGRGALQIAASAAFQGQTAAISIAQTTVVTAAEASSIATGTGAATAGGGLSHLALAGIIGGAGAGIGGAILASKSSSDTLTVRAGTWSYTFAVSVPLNATPDQSCTAPAAGTTVISSDGVFSIPFSVACERCAMSGTVTGTIFPTS